jgi:DNA-binding CsgD family transcriptional regulator
MVALDDLHWADRSSLLLLEFLAAEIGDSPLLIIGTCRDVEVSSGNPLMQTLGELARESASGGFSRIQLRRLSWDDVREYVEAIAQGPIRPETVDALYARTDGNPLFLTELVRMLAEDDDLQDAGTFPNDIPAGIREITARRLQSLSDDCNRALTVASVIGRGFSLDQMDGLIEDISEERLLIALEQAMEAHVIEEVTDAIGRYRFTHALIQEAISSDLSATRRARLHARIAETLEELYTDQLENHASELAQHFQEARSVLGSDGIARYSVMAGERALVAYAHEEALAHFNRALAVREGEEMDAQGAALHLGIARALMPTIELHQYHQADEHLTLAFDYYVESDNTSQAVDVATSSTITRAGYTSVTAPLVRRALELVRQDSLEYGQLLTRWGSHLGLGEGDYDGADAAFSQALDIADRNGDFTLKLTALSQAASVNVFHLRLQRGMERGLEAATLARQVEASDPEYYGHFMRGARAWLLGNIETARTHMKAVFGVAQRLRHRYRIATTLAVRGNLYVLSGEPDSGTANIDRAINTAKHETLVLGAGALAAAQLGDWEAVSNRLDWLMETTRMAPQGPSLEYAFPAFAIPLTIGDSQQDRWFARAESAAETVLSAPVNIPLLTVFARLGLALIAIRSADTARANALYQALEPDLVSTPISIISSQRILGLLSQVAGKPEAAIGHFETALSDCRKSDHISELAWTCHDLAAFQLSRGDHAAALPLIDEALKISREMSMQPLVDRALALKEQIPGGHNASPSNPHRLTEREIDVLRLIADGKTNNEIAEDLSISINTVFRHVSNILSKTNASNRTEAAAYASRHSLLS